MQPVLMQFCRQFHVLQDSLTCVRVLYSTTIDRQSSAKSVVVTAATSPELWTARATSPTSASDTNSWIQERSVKEERASLWHTSCLSITLSDINTCWHVPRL